MLSLPATKGFEFGSGFAGTSMRGSAHNDPFVRKENGGDGAGPAVTFAKNHAGGTPRLYLREYISESIPPRVYLQDRGLPMISARLAYDGGRHSP
jgi:hypothetical protein